MVGTFAGAVASISLALTGCLIRNSFSVQVIGVGVKILVNYDTTLLLLEYCCQEHGSCLIVIGTVWWLPLN